MALQTAFQASQTGRLQAKSNFGVRERISLHKVSHEGKTFRNGSHVTTLGATNQNLVSKSTNEVEKGQQACHTDK